MKTQREFLLPWIAANGTPVMYLLSQLIWIKKALYSSDAVFAAQSTYVYIFEPIYEQIAEQFFTEEWENNETIRDQLSEKNERKTSWHKKYNINHFVVCLS